MWDVWCREFVLKSVALLLSVVFCCGARGEVILGSSGEWEHDPEYEESILRFEESVTSTTRSLSPRIGFLNGNKVELTIEEGEFPKLPVNVVIEPRLDGSRIDRQSLVVRVRKGLGWRTITDEIREWLDPAECPDGKCQMLSLTEDFDLSAYGPGKYTFIVDVKDDIGQRTVARKSVSIFSDS